MRSLLKLAAVVLLFAAAGWGGKLVLVRMFSSPVVFTECFGVSGKVLPLDPGFADCLSWQAELYLERDYVESKDLAKTFLTLISATLVASITFSEKIVDVSKAELLPLTTMIVCWTLLLLALIACGTGLTFMTLAVGLAAYQPEYNFRAFEAVGISFLLGSGFSYVFALIALITAGTASLIEKRAAAASAPAPPPILPSPTGANRAPIVPRLRRRRAP